LALDVAGLMAVGFNFGLSIVARPGLSDLLDVFFFRLFPKYDLAAPRRCARSTGLGLISIFIAMSRVSPAVLFV